MSAPQLAAIHADIESGKSNDFAALQHAMADFGGESKADVQSKPV
jgi:hypothetical protein